MWGLASPHQDIRSIGRSVKGEDRLSSVQEAHLRNCTLARGLGMKTEGPRQRPGKSKSDCRIDS